jgi:ATP-dependent Clp protease ATP-binding subunit ClpA
MFDRLTSGARRAVDLAQAEARSMGHAYIGTEHLLLGLLGEENGIAARTLRAAGVTASAVRDDVQRLVTDLPSAGRMRRRCGPSGSTSTSSGHVSRRHSGAGRWRGRASAVVSRAARPVVVSRSRVAARR